MSSSERQPDAEVIGGPPRKRKSNFDVPPAAAAADSSVDTSAAAKIAQAKAIAALLTAFPNTSSLASVTKYIPEGYDDFIAAEGGQQQVQPVYKRDEVYYARLDRAREKNINYVKRKDLEKLQRQARGEVDEPDFFFASSKAPPKQPRGNSHIKLGLGSVHGNKQQHHQKHVNENTSIYVSGFSPDLTDKDLETLFSFNGKIKKIKMYTFPDGRKKCDALVTFVKVESVASACLQYNNVSIGGGYTLQVSPASFKDSGQPQEQADRGQDPISKVENTRGVHVQEHQSGLGYAYNEEASSQKPIAQSQKQVFLSSVSASSLSVSSSNIADRSDTSLSSSSIPPLTEEQLMCEALPPESEAYDYPIAVIQNVYDGNKFDSLDVEFFIELEADMLEACCVCGRVRRVMTPDHPRMRGTVAVTFEEVPGAQECCVKLNRRRFDGRELTVRLLNRPDRPQASMIPSEARPLIHTITAPAPVLPRLNSAILSSTSVPTQTPSEVKVAVDNSAMTMNFLTSMQESYGYGSDDPEVKKIAYDDDKTATAAANDTEDFLNSLL